MGREVYQEEKSRAWNAAISKLNKLDNDWEYIYWICILKWNRAETLGGKRDNWRIKRVAGHNWKQKGMDKY